MRRLHARWLLLCALGCGGAADTPAPATTAAPIAPAPAPEPSQPVAEEPAPEPEPEPEPAGPWWWATEPVCPGGDAADVQTLTWGRLVWCGDDSALAARRHRKDLTRVARCVRDAAAALQAEPAEGQLAVFVGRAVEAGVAPALCGAVRRDAGAPDVSTHDGRAVQVQRHLIGEDVYDDGGAVHAVRYRFSCASCSGFAETTFEVAVAGSPGQL